MSTILVLFASHYGQTRAIAERIAEQLRRRGHDVDLADARFGGCDLPPEDYDAIVLGSRVELGSHASALRHYIASHRDALHARPTAFFSVSMAAATPGAGPDPAGYLDTLFTDVGWTPARSAAFAGALPYRKYGWLMRFVMKRISQSAGHTTDTSRNHVFTAWDRVEAFADEVAAMVPAAPRASGM